LRLPLIYQLSFIETNRTEKCKTEKWDLLFFCLTSFCLVVCRLPDDGLDQQEQFGGDHEFNLNPAIYALRIERAVSVYHHEPGGIINLRARKSYHRLGCNRFRRHRGFGQDWSSDRLLRRDGARGDERRAQRN
jgi:hypothetical protein